MTTEMTDSEKAVRAVWPDGSPVQVGQEVRMVLPKYIAGECGVVTRIDAPIVFVDLNGRGTWGAKVSSFERLPALPPSPQGEKIDWNSDEAVVRAWYPEALLQSKGGLHRVRSAKSRGVLSDKFAHPLAAWADARKHHTVRDFEHRHNPALQPAAASEAGEKPATGRDYPAQWVIAAKAFMREMYASSTIGEYWREKLSEQIGEVYAPLAAPPEQEGLPELDITQEERESAIFDWPHEFIEDKETPAARLSMKLQCRERQLREALTTLRCANQAREEAERKLAKAMLAVAWACGYMEGFDPPVDGTPRYWWRSGLVKRAGFEYSELAKAAENAEAELAALREKGEGHV